MTKISGDADGGDFRISDHGFRGIGYAPREGGVCRLGVKNRDTPDEEEYEQGDESTHILDLAGCGRRGLQDYRRAPGFGKGFFGRKKDTLQRFRRVCRGHSVKRNAGNDFDVTVGRDTVQLVSYDAGIMGRGRRQKGGVIVRRALIAVGILLACSPRAFALNPALDASQYAHTAWKIREGFSKGFSFSIAQTRDGYLWLGTEFGLLRFDGVRAVPWHPPADQNLPSGRITNLLAARDGTLWIGTSEGLSRLKDDRLAQYPELAGLDIESLIEDRVGTVWAGGFSYTPPGRLCAIQTANVQCYGEDGSLGNGVLRVYED